MSFQPDDRVLYVPLHANGDRYHPDVEAGRVIREGIGGNVFVLFDWDSYPKSCSPDTLVPEQAPSPLDPPLWPSVWHYNYWSDLQGNNEHRCGRLTVYGTRGITYTCRCGAVFTRQLQERIEEAREWVKEHTPHLPVEEQVE